MPPPKDPGECECGLLARMAEDPKHPVEFDPRLNEYHLTQPSGYTLVYFCPFCGGRAPKSQRASLFHRPTDAERERLVELTKNLHTVPDVLAAFGEPDTRHHQTVTTPEREGVPETTRGFPVLTYSRLSEVANVNVTVHPDNRVEISFQGKPMLYSQTHESRIIKSPAAKPPQPEPQINTSKRYDVYCMDPNRKTMVYRNALFKGTAGLFSTEARVSISQFMELEQANGQSVYISRHSIFMFCEPGVEPQGESLPPK